jgi:GT2 family glycosyltransferase
MKIKTPSQVKKDVPVVAKHSKDLIDLSIIVPVYNEIDYVDKLIESLLYNDGITKELLLVDGRSNDGTTEKIKAISEKNKAIKYVDNPMRYVSQGFNKAFKMSKGKYLALVGAHAEYSENYFSSGVQILEKNKADAVGGVLIQKGKSWKGNVIANVMSSKLGVGNTPFRTETEERFVESAAFAIYKREIFERIGFFDEELIRNQDDEFHYRLNAAGFKMLMTPSMSANYFVRENIPSLFKQYYNYGLYKPLVLKKVPSGLKLRHLIPFFFTGYIFFLPLAILYPIYLIPLLCYILLIFYISIKTNNSFKTVLYCMLIFPTLHFSYGLGFLLGLFKL